ncbi:MAG: cytochrome B [Candidatus Dactylopiibacterium carminicum]|uniref:Cytochrome B n=1 Tax=Candidatus Dactylopiibacterium carminicum TaxID=857335 RepID=A0A272ERY4_9RHOO|nr:cytochrome b [Candidatus Dactylopiibacterium carminicum]KAF7598950.1 cytochrome b [Candidatus Dactylopiibacterium carminicum]PAS92864.1 MAG: cytochrome B [Candidatus Dactylopiibacterium carminicum]PAS96369.1 MAG: cytochrome B [Candidatus Dactylopiibacterium carminicum]PAS98969.1 MAG: cytochrome B [Candidatus Dactylopiibacterium carminicum]
MPAPTEYSRSQIVLHWLMFVLFAVALVAIEWRGNIPRDGGQAMRSTLMSFHIGAGLLVFLFAFVRLGIRLNAGAPAILGDAAWQRASAHALHWALYIVMFALPLSGVVFVQAGGREVAFFGMNLPHLVAPDPALRSFVHDAHEFLGNAVYALVGIHIVASLWHHFVLKDDTLRRIRPGYRANN